MNPSGRHLLLILAAMLAPTLWAAVPQLPGARPVVEVIEYPSLQAALDAVPRTGGMVRLPPGEFVITEPLIIRHEDFRLEGAGTATHIKNANTHGQPAIVLRSDAFDEKSPTQRKPLWRVMLANFRLTGNSLSGLVTKPFTKFGENERILYENNQAVACAEVDAKITQTLGTSPVSALTVNAGALQVVAVLHDESALTGAHDIAMRDGIAYVAGKGFTRRNLPKGGVFPYETGKGGSLAIVDVKQPDAPKVLWYARNPLAYEDAETVLPLDGDRLLVGTRDLFLFDVSDPAKPKQLAAIKDRPQVDIINGFARLGGTVFGANKEGRIFAVDVSAPDTLKLLGSRETRESGELGSPHDAAFCGDLLVIVSPEGFGSKGRPGRLGVYRVADAKTHQVLPPAQWTLVGRLEHPRLAGANRVVTRGKYACVGSSLSQSGDRTDDLRSNVSVIELSDPAKPRLRGSMDFPDTRGPNGLAIAGKVVFAAGGQTVQAIDVSTPEMPKEIGRCNAPTAFPGGADDGHDLAYENGHLFVTAQTSHSLVILKVSAELRRSIP